MTERNAGEARLRLVPDAGGFKRKAEAKLKQIQLEVPVKFTADTTKAAQQLEAFRTREGRRDIKLDVEVRTAKARAEVAKLTADLGKLKTAAILNVGALGLGSFPALATGTATLAANIQQLTQAGLVLPGALAGIGAVVGTVKLGVAGLSDAWKALQQAQDGTAESIAKADAAMAKLAPNVADTLRTVQSLTPEFERLQKGVAQVGFDGMSDTIKKLAAADLPILERGLTKIAGAINQNVKQLGTSLSSSSSQSFLDRILGNTGDAQSRITKAIDPIVHAIGTLTAAGSDSLPRLADAVGAVADRFDRFITAADQDGRLAKWIDDGLTGMTDFGNALLNIGKTFTGITKAAGTQGLLGTINDLTGRLSTFVNSTEGQAKLRKFFAEGREQLAQWAPILGNITQIFGQVYQASKEWTDALLPPLQKITEFLANNPDAVRNFATAFVAWKSIDGVLSLVGTLGKIDGLLRTGLPGAAGAGASGISAALSRVAVPAWLAFMVASNGADIEKWAEDNIPGAEWFNNLPNPGDLGYGLRHSFQTPPPPANGVLPTAPTGEVGTVGGIPIPGLVVTTPGPTASGPPVTGGVRVVPGRARGGVLPGYSPGVDNLLVPMSGGEGVIIPQVTRKLGADGIAAINRGVLTHGYSTGGIVDPFGNPVAAGPAPGPIGPVAPNPYGGPGGGGIGSIIGSVVSGIQGPIGNALSLGSSLAGAAGQGLGGSIGGGLQTVHGSGTLAGAASSAPTFADRAARIPGLWGLLGSAFSSDPAGNVMANLQGSAEWLGGWASDTVGGFASALWNGALGFFGLQGSILSASNPWNQAAQQAGQFALGSDGPIGALLDDSGATSSGADLVDPSKLYTTTTSSSGAGADAVNAALGVPTSRRRGSRSRSPRAPSGVQYSGKGAEGWRPLVRQTLAVYGPRFGITNLQAWENALVKQINTESGGNPASVNPNDSNGRGGTQRVAGILNFLQSTFDAYNFTGGAYMDPGAQIAAALPYVTKRWGVNDDGSPRQIGRGQGFSRGGAAHGPGGPKGDQITAFLSDNEHVFTSEDVDAMGGQSNVYAFRRALHRAEGGAVYRPQSQTVRQLQAAFKRPTPPPQPSGGGFAQVPRANLKQLPAPIAPAGSPAPAPAPTPVAPPSTPTQQPRVAGASGGTVAAPFQNAPAPGDLNHNAPWLSKAIESTASALGNAASTAIGVAGGALGGFGGGALGAAGPYIAGLFMQGGKIAEGVANVASSFLVGNVTSGTTPSPYGQTLRPEQNVPNTAPLRGGGGGNVNVFNGVSDIQRLQEMMELRAAMDHQSLMAGRRTR